MEGVAAGATTVNSRYKQLPGAGHGVAYNARFLIARDIYQNEEMSDRERGLKSLNPMIAD